MYQLPLSRVEVKESVFDSKLSLVPLTEKKSRNVQPLTALPFKPPFRPNQTSLGAPEKDEQERPALNGVISASWQNAKSTRHWTSTTAVAIKTRCRPHSDTPATLCDRISTVHEPSTAVTKHKRQRAAVEPKSTEVQ